MTSAIPFMRTTASWIRKLMSAGRSLLRTLSGTIGRVTPNEAFVESRKLRVHPCEVEISSRSHLEQEPWPDEPSHFYLKHHAQIASFEIDNLLYKSVCFTKAYHFACVSHKGMVSQCTQHFITYMRILFTLSKNYVCIFSIKKTETQQRTLLYSMRRYISTLRDDLLTCNNISQYVVTMFNNMSVVALYILFKTFREQPLSAWPGQVTRNSLTKLRKEKPILWGYFSMWEEEHHKQRG